MNRVKQRKVGDVAIYVDEDFRLYVEDRRNDVTYEITDDYKNQQVDKQLMDEVERRIRSGGFLNARGNGRGKLLDFLKS